MRSFCRRTNWPENPLKSRFFDILDGHLVGRPVVELGRARALMRGDRLSALKRAAIEQIRRDAGGPKVWQFASPSPTALTRSLDHPEHIHPLIRHRPSPPARGIERHPAPGARGVDRAARVAAADPSTRARGGGRFLSSSPRDREPAHARGVRAGRGAVSGVVRGAGPGLTAVSPLHVAAYIRTHPWSAPHGHHFSRSKTPQVIERSCHTASCWVCSGSCARR